MDNNNWIDERNRSYKFYDEPINLPSYESSSAYEPYDRPIEVSSITEQNNNTIMHSILF